MTNERVASVLERDNSVTISNWLARVLIETELTAVSLGDEERTNHLPNLLAEIVRRLRVPGGRGRAAVSQAAVHHGEVRYSQRYSIPMLVEESRILQVSIFETLQNNFITLDVSLILPDVMTIADEVDSQLKQTIGMFMKLAEESTA